MRAFRERVWALEPRQRLSLPRLTGSGMQWPSSVSVSHCHICCQKEAKKFGTAFEMCLIMQTSPARSHSSHMPNESGVERERFFMGVVPHICLFLFCLSGHSCVGASAGVGKVVTGGVTFRPCGCGGEGSWHRDLMHKDKQKSHCQGFPPFHSSAGEPPRFRQWDGFFFLSFAFLKLIN